MKENVALFLKYLGECQDLAGFDDVVSMSVEEGCKLPEAKVSALRATLEKSLTKSNIEDKLKARLGNRKAQESVGRTVMTNAPQAAQGTLKRQFSARQYEKAITPRDNVHFGRLPDGMIYVAFDPDFTGFTQPQFSQNGNLMLAKIGWTSANRTETLANIGLDGDVSLTFTAIRKVSTTPDEE